MQPHDKLLKLSCFLILTIGDITLPESRQLRELGFGLFGNGEGDYEHH